MATSWQEMIDLGSREPAKIEQPAEAEPEQRRGVFRRLRESLSKSRQALQEEISASVFEKIDDETWELLEEALILADVGAPTTAAVVERLEHEVDSG
ncbi:MAG TPA: signal recognition particle receptor subunit alpha, partial [Solirubrobacterales bacterium]|nr:signal recognition particle receptor subunit alpha [Solirubrobacterales bacterium]